MNRTTRLALAFLAFSALAGTSVMAQQEREDDRPERGGHFERLDADNSGDVSFEEFSTRFEERLSDADANTDGTITVEELADHIVRQRAERQAERMIRRFDVDGDGSLKLEEIESRQKKHFALIDRNDDGVLSQEELREMRMGYGPRWQDGHRGGKGGHGGKGGYHRER
jgi:Ca2+-binding EF-hand superfamily protein